MQIALKKKREHRNCDKEQHPGQSIWWNRLLANCI